MLLGPSSSSTVALDPGTKVAGIIILPLLGQDLLNCLLRLSLETREQVAEGLRSGQEQESYLSQSQVPKKGLRSIGMLSPGSHSWTVTCPHFFPSGSTGAQVRRPAQPQEQQGASHVGDGPEAAHRAPGPAFRAPTAFQPSLPPWD